MVSRNSAASGARSMCPAMREAAVEAAVTLVMSVVRMLLEDER